jgi:YesN/AraC family two-component response regulator
VSDILEQTMKMVREYAADMKVLVVEDEQDLLDIYVRMFGRFFKICDTAKDGQSALDIWLKNPAYYDLIITDVDMPRMTGLQLIQVIREKSLSQSIIVITGNKDLSTNQDVAYNYVDAILPKPFQLKKITPLLSRVLKKISDQKDLDIYLQQLEQFSTDSINTKMNVKTLVDKLESSESLDKNDIVKDIENISKTKNEEIQEVEHKLTSTQLNDIRYSVETEKMTSLEFMELLDDTIIDKTEALLEHIDIFITVLYDIEKKTPSAAVEKLQLLQNILTELYKILEAVGLFDILVRATKSLIEFLASITEQQMSDENKKSLFVDIMLGLIKDMESWINNVFFLKNADNINYFDASFSNNCMEFVALFNEEDIVSDIEEEDDDDDDDDLEFF